MSAYGILIALFVFVVLYFAVHLGFVLAGVLAIVAGLLFGGFMYRRGRIVP